MSVSAVRAIIHIFAESNSIEKVAKQVSKLPEVVDVYEVTGEFDLIVFVMTKDIKAFRDFLKNKILTVEGVKSTVTSIVLYTHKKEGEETGE
ncbi:MAG: Lrp/AsnC ligand binding domain-containing protein [Candidatus Caldarchaeum sp.]|nr:Lrp/AsnC ligand binding domain-containing protein [Candidatus Caldarchaeum sp.]MCS7110558.1 Lrp/AsnC ligand binding domain-containing protein [Candidatus Caldarchaeum sp.]MCX8201607.1 Lrp/AsnC ligand binding domain-containing protein [Candidatus Caldarchaeum sp.]MDW8062676.1 Lrp/AsnC ligand binding domain-containing protein [Candidatus Caldarchaeum sp.]MDW8435835.1 Lrp/AsnC ligand binding domain-containing protein [Candidatus Caldarchaeum sp.]